tara:strand:- start:14 stop:904 length:891 start_codon:yes stop_codon:yes gene_type:complete
MKTFLKKIFYFSLLILTLIVFSYLYVLNNFSKVDDQFRFSRENKSIYLGDSHIETSLIDSMLPTVINCSKISESVYFSYYKLKYILSKKNNLSKVYLGLGFHSISGYFDDYTIGNQSVYVSPKYYFLLPNDERVHSVLSNFFELPSFYKSVIESSYHNTINKDCDFIGGYYNRFKNFKADSSNIKIRIQAQFYKIEDELRGYSEMNLDYLKRIKKLCDNNNLELFVVNSPVHSYYKTQIPEKFINKYYSVLKENEIGLIDYSDFKLVDKDYTPDGDHVTLSGALKWTKELRDQVHF